MSFGHFKGRDIMFLLHYLEKVVEELAELEHFVSDIKPASKVYFRSLRTGSKRKDDGKYWQKEESAIIGKGKKGIHKSFFFRFQYDK